jgi:uncharacterized membrane protein YdjX (TVP38/TMEM64 family)
MTERLLSRRLGNATWDAILRGTGLLAVVAIGLVLWLPGTATVVVFVLLSLGCHGPLSPFLPAAYEPILLFYGQLFPPVIVALVGAVASAAAEYLNYHLYRAVLDRSGLDRLLRGDVARPVTKLFARRPFLATWICAWSPLPDWAARILAAHSGYPIGRYLAAVLVGRIPKFWLLAQLGLHWLPTGRTLLLIAGGSTLIALAGALRRRATRNRTVTTIPACRSEERALPALAPLATPLEPFCHNRSRGSEEPDDDRQTARPEATHEVLPLKDGSTMGSGRPGPVSSAVTGRLSMFSPLCFQRRGASIVFTAEAQRTQRTRPAHGAPSSNAQQILNWVGRGAPVPGRTLCVLCASAVNYRRPPADDSSPEGPQPAGMRRCYSMIPYATGSWSSGPETHTRFPASAQSLGEG